MSYFFDDDKGILDEFNDSYYNIIFEMVSLCIDVILKFNLISEIHIFLISSKIVAYFIMTLYFLFSFYYPLFVIFFNNSHRKKSNCVISDKRVGDEIGP